MATKTNKRPNGLQRIFNHSKILSKHLPNPIPRYFLNTILILPIHISFYAIVNPTRPPHGLPICSNLPPWDPQCTHFSSSLTMKHNPCTKSSTPMRTKLMHPIFLQRLWNPFSSNHCEIDSLDFIFIFSPLPPPLHHHI